MSELIETEFIDNTSYPPTVSGDIGAIVIDHFWGPENISQSLNLEQFQQFYPATKGAVLSPSYVNAFRAYLSGLQTIEVVRLKTDSVHRQVILGATAGATTTVADIPETGTNTITIKYTGKLPQMFIAGTSAFKLTISSSASGATVVGSFDITVTLSYVDSDSNIIVIETFTGGSKPGVLVDGQDWFIGAMLQDSDYMTLGGEVLVSGITGIAASQAEREYTLPTTNPTVLDDSDLVAVYADYFTDIENSAASILIDPGTTDVTNANIVLAAAITRGDAVALIGYPTADTFDKATITTYKGTITANLYGAFYACKELVTINGMTYASNGIGTIAGRIASIAQQASVNQLPSAKTYGAFGGKLAKTLSFADVLEMHDGGINSVYNTTSGARIFGIKSLHPRATSYYSKFNVSRVVARVLKYGFSVAMDVLHVGNTEARRLLTANLLNSDLTRLKPEALKIGSLAQCDNLNNTDLTTNGGEILIIDYSLQFVKLIEKVKFRITATDSSVTATL